MDKDEKILEKYKIYIGVQDVKLVVRPYKTRTAFTNLTSSPLTIYLNEYLIDYEEIVQYLIIRVLIHIKLHMYPPMRYGVPSLSYTEKFESNLYFLMPKEKVEEIRERIVKKLIEVKPEASATSFFYGAPPRAPRRGPPVMWTKDGGEEAYLPAGASLQVFAHRCILL